MAVSPLPPPSQAHGPPPAVAPALRALAERIFGGALDLEGAVRLLDARFMDSPPGSSGSTLQAQHEAALRLPPGVLAPSAPERETSRAAVQAAPRQGDAVTFLWKLRQGDEVVGELDLKNVEVSDGALDELIRCTYLLAASDGPAELAAGLLREWDRRRTAAEAARESWRRFELNRRSSDVSGTTEEMLAPPSEVARREAETIRLADEARRYERADELLRAARARHERAVAEARNRLVDAAAEVLKLRLGAARRDLRAQATRYGLKPDDVFTYDDLGLAAARLVPVTPEQRQAVASLKAVLVRLADARATLKDRAHDERVSEVFATFLKLMIGWAMLSGDRVPLAGPAPTGSPLHTIADALAVEHRARRAAAEALASYAALRAVAAVVHPAVRFITDPVKVVNGTIADDYLAVRLAKSLAIVNRATARVEERVLAAPGGVRARVFEYPVLVGETLRLQGLGAASLEAVIARETAARRKANQDAVDELFGWAGFVAPLAAGLVSGGLAMVFVGLLLDGASIAQELDEYENEWAAFASALEAAEALAQEEPSRAGLAMAVAFAVAGVVF